MDFATYIPVVVALAVGFAFGRHRRRVVRRFFQNRGEAFVSQALMGRCEPPDYHLLNHLTLSCDGDTTQIDHVLISRFGVFVIETKDLSGWIFANASDRQWTQVLFRARFRFQNPIHQNFKHTCAIRQLLDFLPPEAIHSIVIFAGESEFKTPPPEGVFTLDGFLAELHSYKAEVMSANRVQFCVGRLEATRLAVTRMTDIEHVEHLRRRYDNDS